MVHTTSSPRRTYQFGLLDAISVSVLGGCGSGFALFSARELPTSSAAARFTLDREVACDVEPLTRDEDVLPRGLRPRAEAELEAGVGAAVDVLEFG